VSRTCASCGAALPEHQGRGRPRKFCVDCVPPGTGAAALRAWRAANPEKVRAYNEARRLAPLLPRPCAACGEIFTPLRRSDDAETCGRRACTLATVRTEA
jgi:hypothetical protein